MFHLPNERIALSQSLLAPLSTASVSAGTDQTCFTVHVIPAEAGIQVIAGDYVFLDSRLRGNDGVNLALAYLIGPIWRGGTRTGRFLFSIVRNRTSRTTIGFRETQMYLPS